MAIYTKNGDKGFTRLADGNGVSKSDLRIDAMGDIDELNAHLGLLNTRLSDPLHAKVLGIQASLFVLGAHVACDSTDFLGNMKLLELHDIVALEGLIDEMDDVLTPMRVFILPGGHETIALAQVCRTVCRRAERSLIRWVQAEEKEEAFQISIAFLNRLSDYLFMMCRYLHHLLGIPEIPWNSGR